MAPVAPPVAPSGSLDLALLEVPPGVATCAAVPRRPCGLHYGGRAPEGVEVEVERGGRLGSGPSASLGVASCGFCAQSLC